ncbi:low molecular weight protein-tyrosine-phosphatase [Nocardioides seonyuensis]|nr:low molecular weight protein-tyrosine-phosphatase [Nocardioides seonyuensis]
MDANLRGLPPQQTSGPYRLAVVCLGNICRSPMAHVVLESSLAAAGLADRVQVSSAGTAGWHVGKPMDARAAATLADAGHDPTRHRAQQYDAGWTSSYDLVLVMDDSNLADVGGRSERVAKFRDFDPIGTGDDVPDPYYGGDEGFTEVLEMVARTSETIVERCRRVLR